MAPVSSQIPVSSLSPDNQSITSFSNEVPSIHQVPAQKKTEFAKFAQRFQGKTLFCISKIFSSIKKKRVVIVSLLLFLAALGTITFVFIFHKNKTTPLNIMLTNLTDTSVTVSWVTRNKAESEVIYSKDQNFGTYETIYDIRDYLATNNELSEKGKYKIHFVVIRDLEPNTEYYIKVRETPLSSFSETLVIRTFKTPNEMREPKPFYGRIMETESKEASNALIYAIAVNSEKKEESLPLSTYTSENGTWTLDQTSFKKANGNEWGILTEKDNVVILIYAPEISNKPYTAVATATNITPFPKIILKETRSSYYKNSNAAYAITDVEDYKACRAEVRQATQNCRYYKTTQNLSECGWEKSIEERQNECEQIYNSKINKEKSKHQDEEARSSELLQKNSYEEPTEIKNENQENTPEKQQKRQEERIEKYAKEAEQAKMENEQIEQQETYDSANQESFKEHIVEATVESTKSNSESPAVQTAKKNVDAVISFAENSESAKEKIKKEVENAIITNNILDDKSPIITKEERKQAVASIEIPDNATNQSELEKASATYQTSGRCGTSSPVGPTSSTNISIFNCLEPSATSQTDLQYQQKMIIQIQQNKYRSLMRAQEENKDLVMKVFYEMSLETQESKLKLQNLMYKMWDSLIRSSTGKETLKHAEKANEMKNNQVLGEKTNIDPESLFLEFLELLSELEQFVKNEYEICPICGPITVPFSANSTPPVLGETTEGEFVSSGVNIVKAGTYTLAGKQYTFQDRGSGYSLVTVLIYEDKNGNNVYDAGEKPIENVKIPLSETEKAYSIKLNQGWQLISFPGIPFVSGRAMKASEFLNQIQVDTGYATTIETYDSRWIAYTVRDEKQFGGEDFDLMAGKGYFVKVEKPCIVRLNIKTLDEPFPVQLNNGWSLIGLAPGQKISWKNKQFDDGIDAFEFITVTNTAGLNVDKVTRWDSGLYKGVVRATDENGAIVDYGVDFQMKPEQGYFVHSKNKGVFTP